MDLFKSIKTETSFREGISRLYPTLRSSDPASMIGFVSVPRRSDPSWFSTRVVISFRVWIR